MNPFTPAVPATPEDQSEENSLAASVPDGPTVSKPLLVGWLLGCGAKLPWDATLSQAFSAIKKAFQRAHEAAPAQSTIALPNSTSGQTMKDYSSLSPADASKLFQAKVDEIQKAQGCDLMTAWQRAELEYPELFARVEAGSGKAGITAAQALANEKALNAVPVAGPQLKTSLGLPETADDEEVKAAWRANKGQSVERDSKAILAAMRAVWSGRLYADPEKRNTSYFSTLVENKLRERFPILWQAAG